ncbi:hypothetical protein [Paraflavitalea sp. CAU 1676]|uniref:hypothetical protein n=1 Tax=Paraflavitalea sp. CAU 1676 TaxID=3032598 RepID=UPI0023DC3DD2|nr:hypothetical protein [Paraflavitalea sp. CAU 1676]MDF2190940.1 hypothetical protein [Paraflavitalea sp. CAU 1676]
MQKNTMYYDTHRAKINKDIYRPSSNVLRFFRSLMAVLMVGKSPISSPISRYRLHQH